MIISGLLSTLQVPLVTNSDPTKRIVFDNTILRRTATTIDTTTLYPTADNYMASNLPTDNYGTNSSLLVGRTSSSVLYTSWLKFDVSSIVGVPTAATFRCYITTISGTAGYFAYSRCTRSGSESSMTYLEYDASKAWTTSGGDVDNSVSATHLFSELPTTTPNWFEWTDPGWVDLINYGKTTHSREFEVVAKQGIATAYYIFKSSNDSFKPELVVTTERNAPELVLMSTKAIVAGPFYCGTNLFNSPSPITFPYGQSAYLNFTNHNTSDECYYWIRYHIEG